MIVGVREAVAINSYLHHLLHVCNIQHCVSVKNIYDYMISYYIILIQHIIWTIQSIHVLMVL